MKETQTDTTLKNKFENSPSIDFPDLETEEQISERLMSDSMLDEDNTIGQACVDGLDISESNYGRDRDVYKLHFIYKGFRWVAEFDPTQESDIKNLKKLFRQHNVDIDAASNIIGKKITVIVGNKKPRLVINGPDKSEIEKQSNRTTVKASIYRGLTPTIPRILIQNLGFSIIIGILILSLLPEMAFVIFSAIALTIIGASIIAGATYKPDIPNVDTHVSVKQITE